MKLRFMIATALMVLLMVACGAPAVPTVARVDNVILSRPELDARVKRIQEGEKKQPAQPQAQPPTPPAEIERSVVDLFVQQHILLSIAKQRNVSMTDKEVDDQIAKFRDSVAKSGNGAKLDDVVQERLGFAGESSTEFRQFVSSIIAQQKIGDTLVTTDTVRAEIEPQVKAEAAKKVKEFHSAHILFTAGKPEQGGTPPTEADYAAALEKANKAEERLAKGEDFATLAKELSDDPGSKEKGGEYDWQKQGSFVPEYEKAVFEDLKPGEYTKTPVKSSFGYHIIKLIEPVRESAAIPPEQVQQVVDQQVAQQLGQKRGQALQKLVEDERAKAKKDGRLEEPTYPDPTPLPGAPGAPGAPAPGDGSAPPSGAPAPADGSAPPSGAPADGRAAPTAQP